MSIPTISPQQLHSLVQGGQSVELIDVRTPLEHRAVHAECARNVPLNQLDVAGLMAARPDPVAPLYVICRSGGRATQACERFLAAGYTNVVNVEGGTVAWDRAGLPVTRGKKCLSIQQQVQITAGSLVVLGAVLAVVFHPYWSLLSALVGAGLILTGITDSCLMGMLMARMPWNQVSTASESPTTTPTTGGSNPTPTCCG